MANCAINESSENVEIQNERSLIRDAELTQMHQETLSSTPTTEYTYEGFGSVSPNSKIASAKFRWLTALRIKPAYY